MKYLHLLDLDASSITLRVLREQWYPTHVVIDAVVESMFPPDPRLLGKEITIVAADYRPYIVTGFKTKKIHVEFLIGKLTPYKGYMIFSSTIPSTQFYSKLTSDGKEVHYKNLYEDLRLKMIELRNSLESCYNEKLINIEEIHKTVSRIITSYLDFYRKALGLTSPEQVLALEAQLGVELLPPPPQPSPPPRKSLIQRIKELLSKLIPKRKGRET